MGSIQADSSASNLIPKIWPLVPPFSAQVPLLTGGTAEIPANLDSASVLPALLLNDTIFTFLQREPSVPRLNRIHKYLWLVGRAGNIRPLHRQKVLEREIVITEETDLHLVWHRSRIFIKPLPVFLLDHGFFEKHICCPGGSSLYQDACGLLLSYTWLIRHESDFLIAKELGLISPTLDIGWRDWCMFAAEVRSNVTPKNVNRRYIYGELRMRRLNFIYHVLLGDPRGFYYGYTRYVSFFRLNFGWLLLAFAYVSVVLAAMQTVLSSSFGLDNEQMRRTFGAFSFAVVMAITGVLVLVILLFLGAFLGNFIATLRHKRQQDKTTSLE